MPELKLISPLLDGMELDAQQPTEQDTSVCFLRHTTTGQSYVLKQVDLPESSTQVEALLLTGALANEDEAQSYYEQRVQDYITEFKVWYSLNGSPNLAAFLDYQLEVKEREVGFHVYLLSHRWVTLAEYLKDNSMTWLKALNLGLDLCNGLCQLRVAKAVHRNVKPQNVYIDNLGNFMLGDLGLVSSTNLRFSTMADRMISVYSAPEACDVMGELSTSMDIYSVGMILYRILNGNHGPFEDEETSPKAANKMRIEGAPLPVPLYADYELSEIILKACAFDPADRYQTPEELHQDLVLYMQRNRVSDQLIVPPIITDEDTQLSPEVMEETTVEPVRFTDTQVLDTEFVQNFTPDNDGLDALVKEVQSICDTTPVSEPTKDASQEEPEQVVPEKKSKTGLIFGIVGGLVAAAAIGFLVYVFVLGGPAANVLDLTVTEKYVDYLFVEATLDDRSTDMVLVCTDGYGNETRQNYTPGGVRIGDLEAGTQYTLTLQSATKTKLSGTTSIKASTTAITEIISFTATASAVGQAELNFVVSGNDQDTWVVNYGIEGDASSHDTAEFTGHSTTIYGLTSGETYFFNLLPPEGGALEGEATVTLKVGPEITVENLTTSTMTDTSATLVWDSNEALPEGEEWTVTLLSNDGTPLVTMTTGDNTAVLDELEAGKTYTANVTSPSTLTPGTLVISPTVANVSDFTATTGEGSSLNVSWSSDITDGDWRVLYTPKFSNVTSTWDATGDSATITNLIPGLTYELELQTAAGQKVSGTGTAEVLMPWVGSFNSYNASRFFVGIFELPAGDSWGKSELTNNISQVAPGGGFAFAAESLSGWSSSDDMTQVTVVLVDDMDVPVAYEAYEDTWTDLWTESIFTGRIDEVPEEAGEYELNVYFNGQLAFTRQVIVG